MHSQRRQIDGVECKLQQWERFIRNTTSLFLLWYNLLERIARILDRFNIRWGKPDNQRPGVVVNSIGERTAICRRNSFCRQDSRQCLLQWMDKNPDGKKPTQGSEIFYYDSFTQMISYLVRGCARSAYINFLANVVIRSSNLTVPISKLTKTIAEIERQSAKAVKFRFFFKDLKTFLNDVQQGKGENMSDFIRLISNDISTKRCTWWLEFEHRYLRWNSTNDNVYETKLAIFSLFFQHGGNFDIRGFAQIRESPKRLHDGMLTMLMICAVAGTTSALTNEINVTEFGGTDRILLSSWKENFRMAPSPKGKVSDGTMKDILMWNAMLNDCSEYVESSWSLNLLTRSMWALQWGRKFVQRKDYFKLMAVIGQDDDGTDLTGFDARAILAFVIAGFVRYPDNGNGIFLSLVGVTDAEVPQKSCAKTTRYIRGRLPPIHIQDLIDIHVLRCIGKNKYVIDIPGENCKFNAKSVESSISFVRHSSNMHFSANPTQLVL